MSNVWYECPPLHAVSIAPRVRKHLPAVSKGEGTAMIAYVPLVCLLGLLALSTPVSVYLVHYGGWVGAAADPHLRTVIALANGYAFSSALFFLWLYPISGWPGCGTWRERARMATRHWLWFLSGFTVVFFQSLHSWGTQLLFEQKGGPLEWPFESYSLSDSRWRDYGLGAGLPPYVHYINVNDVCLSVLVLIALITRYMQCGSFSKLSPWLLCIALFRDTTVFRETVEYLWEHHANGYPYTIADPLYRPHAIAILYLVNICWIIAPLLTLWVAYDYFRDLADNAKQSDKNKQE